MSLFSVAGLQLELANRNNLHLIEGEINQLMARCPWVDMVMLGELSPFGAGKSQATDLPGESGAIFSERAASLLSDAEGLFADIQNMNSSVSGRLNIAAAPSLGRYLARSLLPEFQILWPQVSVKLTLSYSYENLFEKGTDLAFRFGDVHDDRLIAKPLGFSTRILVASSAYLGDTPDIQNPEQLQKHQFLSLQTRQDVSSYTVKKGSKSETLQMPSRFQCSDLDALKYAAIGGIGIAELPMFTIQEELQQGTLIPVLPGWTSEALPLSAVYRENLNKPPKLAAFLDFIEERREIFQLSPLS